MSDVSKTNDLIEALRRDAGDYAAHMRGIPMSHALAWDARNKRAWEAADALASRAVQGEPNDDREAIAQAIHDGPGAQEQYRGAGIPAHSWDSCTYKTQYRLDADAVIAAGLPRAVVPDAATDARKHLHAMCNCVPTLGPAHCHLCGDEAGSPVAWTECVAVTQTVADSVTATERESLRQAARADANLRDWDAASERADRAEAERDAATERIRSAWRKDHREMLAKLDAATAAIERVKAIHVKGTSTRGGTEDLYEVCVSCTTPWPCSTRAALDGAPEPEWERTLGPDVNGVVHKRTKATPTTPAGPWLPVEGESKS